MVCNYGPGGNFYGLPLYRTDGTPADNCPNGAHTEGDLKGLCRARQVP